VALMGPLATHHYYGQPFAYEPAAAAGKVIWETEISDDHGSQTPFDGSIDSGLRVANMIHDNLVLGNVSAWHYWWLVPASAEGNAGLVRFQTTTLLPRAWVMGNWSRFVRPGFVRVAIPPAPQRFLSLSAFAELATGRFVIVAINQGYLDLAQDFTIAGGVATEVTPWVTSDSQQLAAQAAVTITDGAFTATLPARSVTSLVGTFMP
jgi:glucuronoarabinoxylan endo-1,4-beta-xylanase